MMGLLVPIIMASLAGTVLWVVQCSLRPITQRVFSQAWHYYTGLVPVFFLLGGSALSNRLIQWLHNEGAPVLAPSRLPGVMIGESVSVLTNLMQHGNATRFATAVWAVGALVYLAVNAWNYWAFKRSVLETSRTCDAVPCPIRVVISAKARTPMLMGLWRPILVLPDTPFAAKALAMIMSHELVHFRRGDLFVKLLVFLANAVHWFNPAVYLLNKQLHTLCELSCDEKVVQAMDPDNRRLYAETLLSMLEYGVLSRSVVLTSGLCSSKQEMKRRLFHVMTVKRTRKSVLTLSLVVACAVVGLGGLVAYAAQSAAPKETHGVDADSLAPSHMLWGGRHVTTESPNGDIMSYDHNGNVQPGRPKGSDTPPELTYEQVLERIRMHEEKGLLVPEAYLDMVRQAE